MATKCICNKDESQRLSAVSTIRATTNITVGNPLRIITQGSIRADNSKRIDEELKIQSITDVKIHDLDFTANLKSRATGEVFSDAHFILDSGVLRARVQSDYNIKGKPHKFGGHTSRLKLLNFEAQEKLYPSSDFVTTLNSVSFRDQNLGTDNIYSGIDEGVYTGNIFKTSSFVTDDDGSYIAPYISGTEHDLTYRFGVNPLNTKAEESFFVIRASGATSNASAGVGPLYKFKNIKLLDPSGNNIITYKDFSFKGDGYYATYFSEPEEIKTRLYTYNFNYPDVGSGFAVGNSGYSVTFDLDIDCLDDPFDQGYNVGYEEFLCDLASGVVDTVRISAIEIQNSGSFFPVDQNYVNLNVLPPLQGERLVKHIFAKAIVASGYDTTIFPSGKSRWQSNTYLDQQSFQNSGEKSVSFLSGYSKARYLRLEEVSDSIPDSGKLILRFEDQRQTTTRVKVPSVVDPISSFNTSFEKQAFLTPTWKTFDLDDAFYADIDEVNLKIIARKAEGSRDFALDIVGYSDDKLLAVTNPSGGFLQNKVAGSGSIPSELTSDAFGINRSFSDGAISEGSDLTSTSQVLNSGGDHYLLTQTPLINSTRFREYTIPLQIHDIIPELGHVKEFNQSSYFEKIYLDIYPIPSGADIADIRLEVYYKPSNAIPLAIVGHQQDNELARDTVVLDIVEPKAGDPAFNKTPLSSFGTLPHAYTDADNLKTNYSRRWQGVVGKDYVTPFTINEFNFSFEKHEKRNPFASGFYDFSTTSGNYVISSDYPFATQFPRNSGLFSGDLDSSTFDHFGWRFNSSGLLTQSSQTYRTTDWASGSHPLSGKIADAFAHMVRVSGENGYFTFDNAATNDQFSAFIRFTPDETISGVGYNQFNSGVLFSKAGDFGLRYSGGYLQAYINTSTGEVNATDTLTYSDYSYPLSVAVTYDGTAVKLYTDNEIQQTSFNILRASGVGTKLNTSNNLLLGSGANLFVSCFGHLNSGVDLNTVNIGESATLSAPSSGISITDLFDQYRMIFADGDTSYQHRNSFWSYIDEDADSLWALGAYRHCSFNHEFNRLTYRGDTNYIEHVLTHDGLPYSSRTNTTLPSNVNTTDLAYHTQLENDFLRFHLQDVPDVKNSGKFYTADVRIFKDLPRGYKFSEEAFVVETVVDSDNVENISWPNGDIGPKLIVSLYSKASVPTSETNSNYGLVNRHIHNINHGCFEKISSKFDYNNLFDESEPWADFVKDSYMKEFDHKYYSTEVDDMFLQYDIAYPKNSSSFTSKLRIHSAEVKLKKALVELPSATDNFNFYVSGNREHREDLGMFFVSPHSGLIFNEPSGLGIYTSGSVPPSIFDSGILYVSGDIGFASPPLDFSIKGHRTFSTSGELFGSYGDSPVYGLQIYVQNSGEYYKETNFNLSTINTEVHPSAINSIDLRTYSAEFDIIPNKSSMNLLAKAPSFEIVPNRPSQGMNLTTMLSDTFLATHRSPFPLFVKSELNKTNNTVNLYTINAPPIDTTLAQQQAINWDGTNVGQTILVADNDYSALAANDEIRGVTTICFGDCQNNGTCTTRAIVSHGIDWNNSSCIDGGIARAQTTYTNSGVTAFNTDTDGYLNHYYGIRKYTGLIPHYPYTITVQGYTGSTDAIEIPPRFETVGYGASDEVNYSGIKHIANDPNAIKAQYGKSVAMRGDLMAIGAPNYTLVDGSGSMEDSGAVFLYRRHPAPTGFDWSAQEDQASWSLEEVLTLPSGFYRDYSYVDIDTVGEPPDASYSANVRKWIIGQHGRNFGYSVDIVSDPNDETKDVVVVGAPRAKFDRTFDEAAVKTIKVLFVVISDNLSIKTQNVKDARDVKADLSEYKAQDSFIINRNRYFSNIASPAFEVEPVYIILSATKNVGETVEDQIPDLTDTYSQYRGHEINRLLDANNVAADSLVIENQIKDIFNAEFTPTAGLVNSGLPATLGLFVDNSFSLGRDFVEPAVDNFIQYFKEYTFASGLLDANDNPISGLVIESREAQKGEEWINAITQMSDSILSNDTITSNLQYFANSLNPTSAPTSSGYNDVPTSGGRVYIFEKEQATEGLFYSENQEIWTLTQEIGLDRYLYDVDYKNERFGHAVAISNDATKIAVGSPYDDNVGVRVYEKSLSYNINNYYDQVGDWINRRVEENVDDVTSIYYSLYYRYQEALTTHVATRTAGKVIYDTLNPSGRFDLKLYCETYGDGHKDKYSEIFSYKNDYNYTGTWTFVPQALAARPRVGYSVALNDDGNILAVGCPTDSMNQLDDSNVYHRNTRYCPADIDKGVHGDVFIPGYDSRLPEDADLVTGSWSDGGTAGTLQSYVNAGAVQLFDSRRYYPHDKVIEYGIFGNKQKSLASSEDQSLYYDLVSGVYSSNITFERTSFTDPEIPQDAGLVFITAPEVDSLSDEVLENIQNWLDYGDRNLVLVGNDPTWENNGAYENTNKIINKILDRLGSRMRLYPARNQYHALSEPSGVNTISATQPVGTYDTYVASSDMQASGVADIRFYDPTMKTYSHDCTEGFYLTNISCQPDIKHEGDLRAEWFDLCEDTSARCVRTPRNILAAYGQIPGLTEPTCHRGQGCYVLPFCEWNSIPSNIYKAPIPILAAAEPHPVLTRVIPPIPERTGTRQVCTFVDDPSNITLELQNNNSFRSSPIFFIQSSGSTSASEYDSTAYSGVYDKFETNYLNTADQGSEWFKPESLTTDYILQSNSLKFTQEQEEESVFVDLPCWCAESTYGSEESYVTLIATVAPESQALLDADRDQMFQFFNNLFSKRLELRETDGVPQVKVAQLGGWTNRNSFTDGYKDSKLDSTFFQSRFKGFAGRPNVIFSTGVVANNADDLLDYDIVWIANTDQVASDSDAETLKQWLEKGNKRLIITYGSEETAEYGLTNGVLEPSIIHANAAYQLCQKLESDIKPAYLPNKKKFATWGEDIAWVETLSPNTGNDFITPWNKLHPLYSSNLPIFRNLFIADLDEENHTNRIPRIKTFVPIETSRQNYVAYYGYERRGYVPANVVDSSISEFDSHYINTGWSKVSFNIPEIVNSGYMIEVQFAVEDPAEQIDLQYNVVTENLATRYFDQRLQDYVYSQADLSLRSHGRSFDNSLSDSFNGSNNRFVKGNSNVTKTFGPFWATSNSGAVYVAANDVTLRDTPFNTSRVVSIMGYPVPTYEIIGKRKECVDETFIIPGSEGKTIVVSPPRREISTSHEIYCPSDQASCLDQFKTPYAERKYSGPVDPCFGLPPGIGGRTSILTTLEGPHPTADGPVVVAQEFYIGNNFEAGVARSRITVISDSSLVQSKSGYDDNNDKKQANVSFINSLYPYTSFPTDTIYNTRYKITSPERGSPYKWFSATNNSGLVERFNRNGGVITPQAANQFRDNESVFDPTYVVRPLEFCECGEPPPCDKKELVDNYVSGLINSTHPFSQFSTTINGVVYRDDNQLFKDTGYDYLDFEIYNEGYPGDLFGYSVKLTNNRLFVGAPFSAFSKEDTILNWSSLSGVPSGEVPSGVELSSYGGAGSVYMFEKNLIGGQYIRNKNGEFIRESGTLDWGFSKKFRPEDIHVGQDLTTDVGSDSPQSLDENNYSAVELRKLTKETDKFGFSIAVESGLLVIGAPGHDFGRYVDDGQASGLFMSKSFDNSFVSPTRVIYDLANSGTRTTYSQSGHSVDSLGSGIIFGGTVLNNGAAFVYTDDYNFTTEKTEWSFLEKIVPEGINVNRQFSMVGSYPQVAFSGAENSRFGSSVAANRNTRSDSDYAIVVGSKDHPFGSGNDIEARKENKGSAYTYDMMLKQLPPAQADSGAFIHSKVFAESGTPKLHPETFLNIVNSGLDKQYYESTGIIYSNSDGEIFLEVSGQDNSVYQYINHRPYISAVYGQMMAGTKFTNGIRLFTEGRPNEASGNINMMVLGSGRANVYNDIGLNTFGTTGYASGIPSGLYLFNNAESPLALNDSGNLYVSGSSFVSFSGTPSGLGFYVSGLLPVDNSGELNVFVSG